VAHVHEHGVAELAHSPVRAAEGEGRLLLFDLQRRDLECLAETVAVRVRETDMRKKRGGIRPAVGVREAAPRAADFAVRAGEVHANGAVALCPTQAVVGLPGANEDDLRIAHTDGVEDDVVTEAPPRHARCRRTVSPENALEVPVTLLILRDTHHRMLDLDVAQQQTTIDEVARIVLHGHAARANEQAVFLVANREAVDREPSEQPAVDLPDVELAVNAPTDLGLDQRPDLLAPRVGPDAHANGHHRDERDGDQRQDADEDDEVATFHED